MRVHTTLLLVAAALPFPSMAQSWAQRMQDPNANFFEVRNAFNAHWQNRPYQRSKGYKVFKRWEWWMEPRVSATGQRSDPSVFQHALKDTRRMEMLQGAKSNA